MEADQHVVVDPVASWAAMCRPMSVAEEVYLSTMPMVMVTAYPTVKMIDMEASYHSVVIKSP